MQVDSQLPSNSFFFFIGLRVKPTDGTTQQVGVVVVKKTVLSDGTVVPGQVEQADNSYTGQAGQVPFRVESDLAATKPKVDVIVVRDQGDDGLQYGSARIDRGAGFGVAATRPYGWQDRTVDPRKSLAGQAGTFHPTGQNLPVQFSNSFFNGGAMPNNPEPILQPGQVVEFIPLSPPVSPPVGPPGQVSMPAAPQFAFTLDGQPISPPVTLNLGVDTVMFDAATTRFQLSWRAVFEWEPRLELTTLKIS